MFKELILLNWDSNNVETKVKKTKLSKMQSLKDLEMVIGVNLSLEKSSKEIHLLVKLAVCREENLK